MSNYSKIWGWVLRNWTVMSQEKLFPTIRVIPILLGISSMENCSTINTLYFLRCSIAFSIIPMQKQSINPFYDSIMEIQFPRRQRSFHLLWHNFPFLICYNKIHCRIKSNFNSSEKLFPFYCLKKRWKMQKKIPRWKVSKKSIEKEIFSDIVIHLFRFYCRKMSRQSIRNLITIGKSLFCTFKFYFCYFRIFNWIFDFTFLSFPFLSFSFLSSLFLKLSVSPQHLNLIISFSSNIRCTLVSSISNPNFPLIPPLPLSSFLILTTICCAKFLSFDRKH